MGEQGDNGAAGANAIELLITEVDDFVVACQQALF